MSVLGGPAVPVVVVPSGAVQGGPAIPVYAYGPTDLGSRPIQGGPALPVRVLSASDLKQNGGAYVLSGEPQALPIYNVGVGSREAVGGPALPVYLMGGTLSDLPHSDSFVRANGALGLTDGKVPGYPYGGKAWTGGAGWTIAANKAANAPTHGATDLVPDGDMEAAGVTTWPAWNVPTTREKSAADKHAGTQSLHIVADATNKGAKSGNIAVTAGNWYTFSIWHHVVSGTARVSCADSTNTRLYVNNSSIAVGGWIQLVGTFRATVSENLIVECGANGETFFDDASLKVLTFADLIAAVSLSQANLTVSAALTLVARTSLGIVANLDSVANPQNCVIAYHDGTNAHLVRLVGGTWQAANITAAAAYGAGRILQIRKSGTTYKLYYHGVQVGTDQTINDAGIVNNLLFGVLSAYSADGLANFTLAAT